MTKRTGASKLIDLAEQLCKAVVKHQKTIEKYSEDKLAVRVALEAALVACGVLAAQLRDDFVVEGD